MPLMIQNVFMYSDSVLFNACILMYNGHLGAALSGENLAYVL